MTAGDQVTPRTKLYDRYTPQLYSVEPGDVGEVWDVSTTPDGTCVATVHFGLCVVVASVNVLEPRPLRANR